MLVLTAMPCGVASRIAAQPVEAWALPSRPFMLRRDRHAPRWAQQRGAPSAGAVERDGCSTTPYVGPGARSVPIEDGPAARPEPLQWPPPWHRQYPHSSIRHRRRPESG